jgi:hypothetical protein
MGLKYLDYALVAGAREIGVDYLFAGGDHDYQDYVLGEIFVFVDVVTAR